MTAVYRNITKEERNAYIISKFKDRVVKMSAYKDLYYPRLNKTKLGIDVKSVLWKMKEIVEEVEDEGCLVDC